MGESFLFGLIIGVVGSWATIDRFYRSSYRTMFETITERFRARIEQLEKKVGERNG